MNPIQTTNSQIGINLLQDKALGALQSNTSGGQQQPGAVLDSFGQIMQNSMEKVNTLQAEASKAINTYATGGPVPLHQVMVSFEKASLALDLTMQVRNKVLQAYQEVSHLSV